MEPLYQTLLTLFCMVCAWVWGFRNGSNSIIDLLIEAFDVMTIEIDFMNRKIYLTNWNGDRKDGSELK